ncbi:hypothetical protein PPROV_000177000 [Pycnococcus provasolii]|uniref:Gfo/Idh/MocA-like oxidoreductase N-terminal domain-containing protein n=1 Tax=Pycnococcus provasolii TaxID=41880 RepID=A0A830H7P2_9CHLO|nr:hypothetical protein PPROV_000177000 [Pycnococcus provasolii]
MSEVRPGVLMVGAGEYTTGCVFTAAGAAPDKPAGVVAITMADLRRRGKVHPTRMVLADAVGSKMPTVRATMKEKISDAYKEMDLSMETLPADDVDFDAEAYKAAIARMQKGDVVTIFTPDDTHFQIALECIKAGLHVLIAKPAVKTLEHCRALVQAAEEQGDVLVAVEYHKRFDPIYTDARDRIRGLGAFSFFNSTMTQPKAQLDTFRTWAGKSSDISYYLNSHHMDVHAWSVSHMARPKSVSAVAARGCAEARLQPTDGRTIEDTVTVISEWENDASVDAPGAVGTALYTASWVAPKADCHTQQYFHYMGFKGEIRADQAHRGYTGSTDENGFAALNPLYMKYTPNANGYFAGQNGYGYRSIEVFVDAAHAINTGATTVANVCAEGVLATIDSALYVTALLEAGRLSLDNEGCRVAIAYDDGSHPRRPTALKLQR